ncbi:nucleoporin NUP188-like [Hydractinia symbiolongicarpus]|uniref:nucleoporin NUP188-like n=1 Tax=Hydractinia symbiolongicarpus TaxID=13093 RepID=UPI00254F85CF|nr:nucleoporin NUP188-like [Hydractinia symbiolongicarpus]
MLSTRELWNVISGRSSLSDPTSIGEELNRFKPLLENGIDFYKTPNPSSLNKLKSTESVKRKEFILKLSQFLDLDEWQTHELFQNYLRIDFRGSGPQLQAILKHDAQLDGFLLKVLEFYMKERSYLLRCIKYLISYWQDETCLYREEFAKVVDDLANKNFIQKIIKQLKEKFRHLANHAGIKGNAVAQGEFTRQYILEQCHLVEIVFLYYKDFEMPLELFLDLANFFRCQHFGVSQVNRKFMTPNTQHLIERFGYISSLVLLEGLDLELLRKSFGEDESSDVKEHHILKNNFWKKVDELLYSWDDVAHQGPVLMAWTVFRHVCLPQQQQQLTKMFGDAAIRCNVINYLHNLLLYPLFEKKNDPLAGLVKSFVYILMSLMLTIFHEDTLGDYQTLISISCKILSEPSLSLVFLSQDQAGGLGLLLNSTKKRFPYQVTPYIRLLASLCTSEESADMVFEMLEKQNTLTELFGKNNVSEIEACENMWKRKIERIIIKYQSDSITLDAGVYGKLFAYKQDIRLIRWTYSYSGWLYLMLQLNGIIDNPMTHTTDAGEDGLLVAKCIVEITSEMLQHDPNKIEDLEAIIASVVKMIRRVSQLKTPPVELLASCLKCLQFVSQQLPLEIWTQLSHTKFLPSHNTSILQTTTSSHLHLATGFYGVLLNQLEMTSGDFAVTREYLGFVLQCLNGLSLCEAKKDQALNKLQFDVAVNIVFIIKEVFANFGKWRFATVEDKERIGLRCLEIFHLILSPAFNDFTSDNDRNAPSLKSLVLEGLLYHNAGESLLSIVSVGVDTLEEMLTSSVSQMSNIIQLVKLSFAVINRLLYERKRSEDVSPLEDAFRLQYVTQVSELDFIQTTEKVTLLSLIAKFIYHREDPKLPTLAVIVLRLLVAKFPLILTACFGESLEGIRNAFVNRLNGRVEALRLKVAIIEFLTTCVETQPGIIESFTQISQGKDKKNTIGKFSCLLPILDVLQDKQQIDILTSSALEFLAAIWMNRYDVAMTLVKKSKDFWDIVINPLYELPKLKASKWILEVTSHILNIVAYEAYYVKSDQFDEELDKKLRSLSDGKSYSCITHFLLPNTKINPSSQLLLVKSWRMFLCVMSKTQESTSGLEDTVDQIFHDLIKAIEAWLPVESVKLKRDMMVELSHLCWMLCHKWKRLISNQRSVLASLDRILRECESVDKVLHTQIQQHLYLLAVVILQDYSSDDVTTAQNEFISMATLVCKWLQFDGCLHFGDPVTEKQDLSTHVVSMSLLNELLRCVSPASAFVNVLKENGVVYGLLNTVDICIQRKTNLDYVAVVLSFLLDCAQVPETAEHLIHSGVGNFLSLSVKKIYLDSTDQVDANQEQLFRIWSLVVGITSRLLKVSKFAFLQSSIDFIGTHKETIFQSMNLITQLVMGDNLQTAEQLSALCYELAIYQNDISFALPEVFQNIKHGIAQMVRTSVALLARQKLLSHLVECKAGDNIEHIINRTKTPSPTSFRSDSAKSGVNSDVLEQLSPHVELAHNRLINILCNSVGTLRRLTPNVVESILDEGMDIDSFSPLIDLSFQSPSLDAEPPPSFGTLVSCLSTCLKMIKRMSQCDSDRTTPDRDFIQSLTTDDERRRSILWFIIDNALIVLISQASCYLRHPSIEARQKQFLKRELGSELSNFLHAVQRFRSRRGIPPSPISSDKLGSSMSATYRRSPSKLSTSFSEEEENSLLKLIDVYTKNLLR